MMREVIRCQSHSLFKNAGRWILMEVDVVRRKSLHLVRYVAEATFYLILQVLPSCTKRNHRFWDVSTLVNDALHEIKLTAIIKHALDEVSFRNRSVEQLAIARSFRCEINYHLNVVIPKAA